MNSEGEKLARARMSSVPDWPATLRAWFIALKDHPGVVSVGWTGDPLKPESLMLHVWHDVGWRRQHEDRVVMMRHAGVIETTWQVTTFYIDRTPRVLEVLDAAHVAAAIYDAQG